jgi:hypothetical protein
MEDKLNFGDLVDCDLRASHGGDITRAYIIGFTTYGPDTVAVIADGEWHGMAVNVGHLTRVSAGHDGKARKLRNRYDGLYPGFLAPHA